MGVQAHAVPAGQRRGVAHQFGAHRKRGAGGQGDAHHGAGLRVVPLGDHPFAVGQDGLRVLDHRVGRQAAVLDRAAHGTARGVKADAGFGGGLDGDVDQVGRGVGRETGSGGRWSGCSPSASVRGNPPRRPGRTPRPSARPRPGRGSSASRTARCRRRRARRGSGSGTGGGGC